MFLVISVYFNLRNILPKSGTFPPGHSVYIYISCNHFLEVLSYKSSVYSSSENNLAYLLRSILKLPLQLRLVSKLICSIHILGSAILRILVSSLKRKANWIGHILRRNCLLKQVIEGKIKGEMEVARRPGRRRKKLLDDLKDRRGYSHLKEEALDRTMWRHHFGGGFGPVVRKNT